MTFKSTMFWALGWLVGCAALQLDRQVGGVTAVVDSTGYWVVRGCADVPYYNCHPAQRGVLVNTQFVPSAGGVRYSTSLTCSTDRALCLEKCLVDPSCMAYRPESVAATTFYYTDRRGSGKMVYTGFVNHRCGTPTLPCQATPVLFQLDVISLPAYGAKAVQADLWLLFYNSQRVLITAANLTSTRGDEAVLLSQMSADGLHVPLTLTAQRPGSVFELPTLTDGPPLSLPTSRKAEVLAILAIIVQVLVPLLLYSHAAVNIPYYWRLFLQRIKTVRR